MIQMKPSYITGVLEMDISVFDMQYPDMLKLAKSHSNHVKAGVQQIDLVSGLTKHQLSVERLA
jgi:hypothetical protein